MSKDAEDRLDSLFAAYAASLAARDVPWPSTDEEIDDALDEFEALQQKQADPAFTAESITPRPLRLPRSVEATAPEDPAGLKSLFGVVRQAYEHTSDGASVDYLIADPDLNVQFVQACWSLGARAPQYELTRSLLNLRKAGRLGRVHGVRRHRVPRATLERYLFSIEFAMRLVQDAALAKGQVRLTLDRILCDPSRGRDFVEIAQSLSSGLSPFDCRWAALCLRKGINRERASRAALPSASSFRDVGPIAEVRPDRLDPTAGLYWLRQEGRDIYVGSSTNLRALVERLLKVPFDRLGRAGGLFDAGGQVPGLRLFVTADGTPTARAADDARTALVMRHQPRLNLNVTPGRAA